MLCNALFTNCLANKENTLNLLCKQENKGINQFTKRLAWHGMINTHATSLFAWTEPHQQKTHEINKFFWTVFVAIWTAVHVHMPMCRSTYVSFFDRIHYFAKLQNRPILRHDEEFLFRFSTEYKLWWYYVDFFFCLLHSFVLFSVNFVGFWLHFSMHIVLRDHEIAGREILFYSFLGIWSISLFCRWNEVAFVNGFGACVIANLFFILYSSPSERNWSKQILVIGLCMSSKNSIDNNISIDQSGGKWTKFSVCIYWSA